MSDKMTCPGCHAESSSILMAVNDDLPCPFCGLSADAILEIGSVRRKKADEQLKEQLETALAERDRALTEAAKLRGAVEGARHALGCEFPYVPHDAPSPKRT